MAILLINEYSIMNFTQPRVNHCVTTPYSSGFPASIQPESYPNPTRQCHFKVTQKVHLFAVHH